MRTLLSNFRLIDEETDFIGSVILEHGLITNILPSYIEDKDAAVIIDGGNLLPTGRKDTPILMPAFVDLHAHFRDPGFPEKETLESASLSAVAGGFGTVVCMANTKPVTDTIEKAAAIKNRSDALGLIDLYPVLSLSKNMEGKELSGFTNLPKEGRGGEGFYIPLMLSEDGKDMADDELFLAAMNEAKRLSIPISCHCDFGGPEAEALKKAGEKRKIWSRVEENNAVRRVIELGKKTGCHIHIAHVSTKEAVEMIRRAKAELREQEATTEKSGGFTLTCEAMPHNFCLTEDDAAKLGEESFGRVNPPLRTEGDRLAIINALNDGTIDAIATDHAPHTMEDKVNGAPGFSGLETAFAASFTELVRGTFLESDTAQLDATGLKRLSSLMSANPARLLGFSGTQKRGRISKGYRADLVIIDPNAAWTVNPAKLKTRGKNSPFTGRILYGEILMTINSGQIVFEK